LRKKQRGEKVSEKAAERSDTMVWETTCFATRTRGQNYSILMPRKGEWCLPGKGGGPGRQGKELVGEPNLRKDANIRKKPPPKKN